MSAITTILSPTRNILFTLRTHLNKPSTHLYSKNSSTNKGPNWLLQGLEKLIVGIVLLSLATLSIFYSLASYPIRQSYSKERVKKGIEFDLARCSPKENQETKNMVHDYFKKHEVSLKSWSESKKENLCNKIIAQCARSQKVYGPVARNFVDYLLDKASREGKKLLFLARDGILFHQIANQLMKKEEYKSKYPQFTKNDPFSLAYFSRKLIHFANESEENRDLFKRYASEELGLQKGDQYLFVDIGFQGSMVDTIRKLLPEISIDFEFLISTTEKANGFIGNPQNPLSNIFRKGNDRGVIWAEETHHGNTASATKLITGTDRRIHTDNLYPKRVIEGSKFSEQNILRKFCLKKLVDYASNLEPLSHEQAEKARAQFDETIGKINNLQLSIFSVSA